MTNSSHGNTEPELTPERELSRLGEALHEREHNPGQNL